MTCYLILFWLLTTSLAVGQTLMLGDIKLKLGMSKQDVLNQFAFVTTENGERITFGKVSDDALVTASRASDVKNCSDSCFAMVQFTHSHLTYASKSLYSAGTPERTLSEIIGGFVNAFKLPANGVKAQNCEFFYFMKHNDSGARETVEITCAGHVLTISTFPLEDKPAGDISESIGRLRSVSNASQ